MFPLLMGEREGGEALSPLRSGSGVITTDAEMMTLDAAAFSSRTSSSSFLPCRSPLSTVIMISPSSSFTSWPTSSSLRSNQKRWHRHRHVDYNDDDNDDILRLFAAVSPTVLSEDKEEYDDDDDDDDEGEKGGLMVTTIATAENNEYFKEYINDNHDNDRDDNDEAITTILKRENELLRNEVMLLQQQNENLRKRQRRSSSSTTTNEQPPRLLIENFEEESDMFFQLRSKVVADTHNNMDNNNNNNDDDDDDDDGDQCIYDEQTNSWICPIEPNVSFIDALRSRATWLVGLLALQSCSGFILSNNEELLQHHPVIIYFLTMLVGAGGNAGNQASVRVIRGLALGTLTTTTTTTTTSSSSTMTTAAMGETRNRFLLREFRMALALSLIMAIAGYVRASVFHTPAPETLAVTLALIVIVFTSVCLGAMLPLILQFVGIDPVHSSTTIQVVMDILGVVLTVLVSTFILDSTFGKSLLDMELLVI